MLEKVLLELLVVRECLELLQWLPDLTAGGEKDKSHDWLLGPTGLRGWMFYQDGRTTDARQILVTAVDKGSPADGILAVGDVILGAGGKPFDGDARIRLANAITAAETKQGGGVLRLIRWRAGQTANVELKLKVLGSYSDTAPYDCPKSKAIFEQGCELIAKRGSEQSGDGMAGYLNMLALLASGKEEYRPLLDAYARKWLPRMNRPRVDVGAIPTRTCSWPSMSWPPAIKRCWRN